jgi:cob(I)alamin adenosyltransferase
MLTMSTPPTLRTRRSISANRLSDTMFAMRRYSANNIGLGNTVLLSKK